jgi:lipopolysaccharide biosynthesis protein
LVLVYRPSLLPDPKATAERWRNWCRQNGIGEIYLAYSQSFEKVDPGIYGFDAAIEFPPNNSGPRDVTSEVTPLAGEYEGKVYDWKSLAERSQAYQHQPYKLFRGVCPGWDNTARRKANASVLVNNNPADYENWLRRAISDTTLSSQTSDERLIFVNAWNEWAEGAHLEPDLKDGYAYLEATRRAVEARPTPPRIAVAIHAFYPDVLSEILSFTSNLPHSVVLFVTTTADKAKTVETILSKQDREFELIICKNHGRDVLPFLSVIERLVERRFDYVAKVHTKKSPHREDGGNWRRELYEAVIGVESFCRSIVAMENDLNLGMLGPEGHLVSMDTYLGSNLEKVAHYAEILGVDQSRLLDHAFFAGTMFIARVSAIEPIIRLGISANDFEPEAGQIDGTLAHALERILGLVVSAARYRIGYATKPSVTVEINRRYGYA